MTNPLERRDITSPPQRRAVKDLIQSIFIAELLKPSLELWLSIAWIGDIEVIDNSSRQFSSLYPDWPARMIKLSEVLTILVSSGAKVYVIIRKDEHNFYFCQKVEEIAKIYPESIKLFQEENYHEKCIVGDDYMVSGSMNATKNGFEKSHDFLTYTCIPAEVSRRRIALATKWREI